MAAKHVASPNTASPCVSHTWLATPLFLLLTTELSGASGMAALLPRRTLGRTGLSVSVLGFGASPLGGVFEAVDEVRALFQQRVLRLCRVNSPRCAPTHGAG